MSYDAPPPPPPPYGQDPYGQGPGQPGQPGQPYPPQYAAPAYAISPYSHWGKRVGAYLVDAIVGAIVAIPLYVGYGIVISQADVYTDPDGVSRRHGDVSTPGLVLIALGALLSLVFTVWNYAYRQGRTGYTVGKSALGIRLISERTGQPLGIGLTIVRFFAHFVDTLICYLGWLWPLWDAKRQTIGDKIMGSVVVDQPPQK